MTSNNIESDTEDILFAIADATDEDLTEMDPLEEVIDTEALARLVQSGPVEVRFAYEGFRVTVRSPADVDLKPI